ncbi:MAG: hypothetical protein L3J41_10340 [Melioribacteraceae bacterium]|nr:hypothetical protein [Melioribacteraceae bacterium]
MMKKFSLVIFLFVLYFQIYAQNETIRSFNTGAFEVINPQKAIIELGLNTSDYGSLYFDWLYSFNNKIAINFNIRPVDDFGDYFVFFSSSYNLTKDLTIGSYIHFYWSRIGLFASYRAKIFDTYFDTKLGGDFRIESPPFNLFVHNYFFSLSTKKRIFNSFQLIGEAYFEKYSPYNSSDDGALLFSIGSEYQLFNQFNIRTMIGYSFTNNSKKENYLHGVFGVNYIFN